jgi:hypothetical protein
VGRYRFAAPPHLRRFHGLCLARSLPAVAPPLRAHSVAVVGLLAGSSRRETRLRSGLRSSSRNPLGNCVGARVETSRGPNSARARFLIAPCRSAPDSCHCPVMTPARGAGDICLALRFNPPGRGRRHQLPPSIPRSPGIISAALSLGFSARRAFAPIQSLRTDQGHCVPEFFNHSLYQMQLY